MIKNNGENNEPIERMVNEDVNVVGSGAIAGGGYNGKDDVKVGKKAAKKYKNGSKEEGGRKLLLTFKELYAQAKSKSTS